MGHQGYQYVTLQPAWLLVIFADNDPFLRLIIQNWSFQGSNFGMSENKQLPFLLARANLVLYFVWFPQQCVCTIIFLLITSLFYFQLALSQKTKTGHPFSLSFITIFQMRYPSIYKKCSTLHFHHFWVSSGNVENVLFGMNMLCCHYLFFCLSTSDYFGK